MPLRRLYSHALDFADNTAYQDEFPYDPPSNLTTSASADTAFGATSGPDGQPGVAKTGGSGAFGFDKMNMEPQGRLFRVKGRWKLLGSGGGGTLCSMFWVDPGTRPSTFEGPLVIATFTTGGQISISVKTTSGFSNAVGNVYFEDLPGVFTPGTPFDFWVEGARSTITETSPGVFAPDTDGWLKAYVDGVEIADFGTMPIWLNESTLDVNPAGYYWNGVSFRTNGAISDIEIWDELAGKVGCLAVGYRPTVTGNNAVLFAQSGSPETNAVDYSFKVVAPGGIVLDGPLTFDVALDDLTDVTVTSPAANQVVAYNGSAWVNANPVMRSATVTLTNAQIKALPTTPITLVAAPGAGLQVNLALAVAFTDFTAGAYTNVNATSAAWVIDRSSGNDLSMYLRNKSADSVTNLSTLLGAAKRYAQFEVFKPYAAASGVHVQAFDTEANTGLRLKAYNASDGDYTGGNAANTAKVVVYYTVDQAL